MRVLVVQPQMAFYGGAERVIVKLMQYMDKHGIENTLLTLSLHPSIRKDLNPRNVVIPPAHVLSDPRFPYSIGIFPTVAILGRYVRKHSAEYDVVNVHNFPAELTAQFSRRPVVWMCNEPPVLYFRGQVWDKLAWLSIEKLDRYVVRNRIKQVCVADRFNAKRIKRLYGVKPVVIPYGIDCELFEDGNPERATKWLGIKKDDFLVVQVGMGTPFKNQLATVEAVAKVRKYVKNIKVVFAGRWENDYLELIRRRVRELKLEDRVFFFDHLPREKIRDLYARCDVAVFPVKEQGGWLSPFEAMCAEAPVIVSTRMTAAALIKEHKLATVTEDYAGAIVKVFQSPNKYKKIAKRAHRWVKDNFTWEVFCERMTRCFTCV